MPPPPSTTVPQPSGSHEPADAALARAVLAETRAGFAQLRTTAERAVAQVDDAALWRTLDAEANSIGVLLRHVGGNLRSRFTDFLGSDGEKPDRDRDAEFVARPELDRAALLAEWHAGWAALDAALGGLEPADLGRTVHIRGEPATVLQALARATRHVAQHVGQIVLLARHACGARWETLTIPRGGSAAYLAAVRERHEGGRPRDAGAGRLP